MKKLTKIIATIGPSTQSYENLKTILENGADIIRFNLKHNDHEWHKMHIEKVRTVANDLKKPIGILLDMQGPEIRITVSAPLTLTRGSIVTLVSSQTPHTNEISVSHNDLLSFLSIGQHLSINDGQFIFYVTNTSDQSVTLESQSEGTLTTNKSLNIPDSNYPLPTLTQKDYQDLLFAKEVACDFLALSFVRNGQDLQILRSELKKLEINPTIVSKIETKTALSNLDDILPLSDAIMVARGDLGVEIPLEEVPYYQKHIITECMKRGIPVITATQMLESMIEKPYATRAEISDIANAVYDCTDAVMLSGETAYGKYPDECVTVMGKTLHFTEKKSNPTLLHHTFHINTTQETICDAAYKLYEKLHAHQEKIKGFLVCTHTGTTAKMLSRYRAKIPIFAYTPTFRTFYNLTLNFGVFPFLHTPEQSAEIKREDIRTILTDLKTRGMVSQGDTLIALYGDYWTHPGKTSTIRMVTVDS